MNDSTQRDGETTALDNLDGPDLAVCSVRVLLDQLGEVLGLVEASQ